MKHHPSWHPVVRPAEVNQSCTQKAKDYKERQKLREGELSAIEKTIDLLSSQEIDRTQGQTPSCCDLERHGHWDLAPNCAQKRVWVVEDIKPMLRTISSSLLTHLPPTKTSATLFESFTGPGRLSLTQRATALVSLSWPRSVSAAQSRAAEYLQNQVRSR